MSDAKQLAVSISAAIDWQDDNDGDAARSSLAELVRRAEEADTLRRERDEALDIPGAEIGWDGATTEWQRRAEAAEAECDKLRAVQDAAERLMAALVEPDASEARRELQRALAAASGDAE